MKPFISSDRNQSFTRCGCVMIAATGALPISDQSVDEMIEHMNDSTRRYGQIVGGIQYSLGGNPTVSQRRRFAEHTDRALAIKRFVLISDAAVARYAITAIGWLTKVDMRAFSTEKTNEAISYLRDEIEFPVA